MRAVDQDAGINASIRYAWNAGINISSAYFWTERKKNYHKHYKYVYLILERKKKQKGGAEYLDFFLDPLNGSVFLNRSLEDNELVQPVILVVKVCARDISNSIRQHFLISKYIFFHLYNENKKGASSR